MERPTNCSNTQDDRNGYHDRSNDYYNKPPHDGGLGWQSLSLHVQNFDYILTPYKRNEMPTENYIGQNSTNQNFNTENNPNGNHDQNNSYHYDVPLQDGAFEHEHTPLLKQLRGQQVDWSLKPKSYGPLLPQKQPQVSVISNWNEVPNGYELPKIIFRKGNQYMVECIGHSTSIMKRHWLMIL